MKKLLTISLVLCLCLSLFGCSKPKDDHITPGGPTETFDLPEDTLPFEESQTSVTSSDSPFDTVTLPTEDTEATSETSDEVTEEQEDEPVRELPKEEYPDCRAGDMLRLLNGEKAHAKFTEAVSYDGEHMSTGNLEYYIDGIDMMFIDDYNCIIMDGVTQIVIDFESGIYYVEDYHEADY